MSVPFVEDEDTVRLLSRHILQTYGYTVIEDAKILIIFDGPPNGDASSRSRLTS